MEGLARRALGALVLLLGIALGARVIYSLFIPLLPLLICGVALLVVYHVATRFWRRL
jgi:hypothetical protein